MSVSLSSQAEPGRFPTRRSRPAFFCRRFPCPEPVEGETSPTLTSIVQSAGVDCLMTDLNDLKLDKWQGSFEPEPSRRGWLSRGGLVVLLAIGAAVYFLAWRKTPTAPADVRAATEQAVAPAAPTRPLPEAGGATIDLGPSTRPTRLSASSCRSFPRTRWSRPGSRRIS